MSYTVPVRIKSITEYHRLRALPKPEHPLVSVINFADIGHMSCEGSMSMVNDFYSIALKRNFNARMKYGQQEYDFDEGIMTFMSPGQVLKIQVNKGEKLSHSGWLLLFHADFLWNTPLAKIIKKYEYFDYSIHEALFLSDKEETTVTGIMKSIEQEYHTNIDKFSAGLIVSQLELLLNYSDRFYHRQFITRKISNHQVLDRLNDVLTNYFNSDDLVKKGLPSVQYIAESLKISPTYLRGLLKVLTGQNTQQHIHDKLLEKAKEKLSTTNLSINEIAYELGFEHPQSFSKLFKTKTSLSPMQFRQSFV